MDQDLDHKMVDKELVHHLAMDFLDHSYEEVDRSVEVVVHKVHNHRMVDILPKG